MYVRLVITSFKYFLAVQANYTYPLDYVAAINTKVFIRYCFLTGYQLKKNDTETIDITLVCQLLGDVVPERQ